MSNKPLSKTYVSGPAFLILSVIIIYTLILTQNALASSVWLDNVTLEDPNDTDSTIKVQFDIGWNNSWKNNTNHDAVWVFVKYYSTNSGSVWKQAVMKYAGINPDGFRAGDGDSFDLIVPDDKMGCFIQRQDDGTGTVKATNVELLWDYSQDGTLTSSHWAKVISGAAGNVISKIRCSARFGGVPIRVPVPPMEQA